MADQPEPDSAPQRKRIAVATSKSLRVRSLRSALDMSAYTTSGRRESGHSDQHHNQQRQAAESSYMRVNETSRPGSATSSAQSILPGVHLLATGCNNLGGHNLHMDERPSAVCLQGDPAPDFPEPDQLRQERVQEFIHAHLFSDEIPLRPPVRYRVRILKQLISKIEDSIEDWEQHGISDNLTNVLASLLSQPLPTETEAAQQREYVVYHLSLLQGQYPLGNTTPRINLLESRALISAGGTTGLRTWEAALHMGQYLCAHPSVVANKRVLELGSGTGYLAVLCSKFLGAAHVVATDGSEEVVSRLGDSFFLNSLQESPTVSASQLAWGRSCLGAEWLDDGVDVILGADVTYDASVIPALVATINDMATRFPGLGFAVSHEPFPVPPRSEQKGPFYNDASPIHICKLSM
ncbi:hypothetical protein VTJ04DRAFT_8390 [Mycothermus thermophilus]|uniref:uncharacterized protein n=1 Tax=Humicola insolens TaxID=85995 RepID=UPI003743D193